MPLLFIMNSSKPLALVTNDDGIDSNFLHVLCDEVSQYFEIIVCAPDGERSWIGHAISRHQKLKAVSKEGFFGQHMHLMELQLTV